LSGILLSTLLREHFSPRAFEASFVGDGVPADRDDDEPAAIIAEAIGFPGDGGLSRLRHGKSGRRGNAERGAACREDHPSLHVGSPSLSMLGGRHDAVAAIGHGASRI
jgi:hypothetical protein